MSVNDSSNTSRTDWAALEAMTDEEIDYSDIPPLTDEFFDKAILRMPAAQADNLIQLTRRLWHGFDRKVRSIEALSTRSYAVTWRTVAVGSRSNTVVPA